MIKSVQEFSKKSDSGKTKAALKELQKSAIDVRDNWPKASAELMPSVIETIKADATLGESMEILKEVFGWDYNY